MKTDMYGNPKHVQATWGKCQGEQWGHHPEFSLLHGLNHLRLHANPVRVNTLVPHPGSTGAGRI